jgi:ATP synthase protein I
VNPNEKRASNHNGGAAQAGWDDASQEHADDEAAFKILSREEAQDLRARKPSTLSPWRVVAAQAVAGLLCAALWWLFSPKGGGSALYGAIAVVVPNALMAWGTTRRPAGHAGAALLSMMVWELIKIFMVIAILVVVAKTVSDLSWPALLLTMIVSLKVNWLALLVQGRFKKISDGN